MAADPKMSQDENDETPYLLTLLGEDTHVFNGKGEPISVRDLVDKTAVAFYFSASWCPPCRQFTPVLAQAYSQHLHDKGLEVIFVSSDNDAAAEAAYFSKMPWLTLSEHASGLKRKLASTFSVRGIPMLVLVEPKTGKVLTTDGRGAVSGDPTGENYPWEGHTSSWWCTIL